MLNDRHYRSTPSSQVDIDQMNAIKNEISHHVDLFSPTLLRGKWKDMVFDTCAKSRHRALPCISILGWQHMLQSSR